MTRDEMIEDAAQALYDAKKGGYDWNIWDNEPEWHRDEFRATVRIVLPALVAFVADWLDAHEDMDNPSIERCALWREEMGAE